MSSVLGQPETAGFLLALNCRYQLLLALDSITDQSTESSSKLKPYLSTWLVAEVASGFTGFILLFLKLFLLPSPSLTFPLLLPQALFFCCHCWLEPKASYKVTSHETSAGQLRL